MIRQDYILEWIKRYVRWIAEIMGFVRAKDYEAAIRRIDMALRTLLEVGSDSVTSLTEGDILARLSFGGFGPAVDDKCMVIAALLKQLGIVCAEKQQTEMSRDCFLKCLQLVLGLKLREEKTELTDYTPTVEELVEFLRPYDLPPRTHGALMVFFEGNGRFALAENALFALIESAPDHSEPAAMGVAFYKRLLTLDDETLVAGDLPRAEVEAGLAEVRKRAKNDQNVS